ncbi:MAG TPA: tetratricopeptide repeat protein [Thermomicrobiales bacterium]|nr:tetratricopeptide repeat protein [Thermomicrobiales bacterium]
MQPNTAATATRERPRTRRQLVDDARQAALNGDWSEALRINDDLIEHFAPDADAYNRRGRALCQHGRYAEAFESYQEALRLDPANMIARRNLQRLEILRSRAAPEQVSGDRDLEVSIPRPHVFIEEVGKTWSGELVNPTDMETLAEIASGEQLNLTVEGERLYAETLDGTRLGEFETETARRVIALITGGNRYEVYALGASKQSLRVILREVYRDPAQATRVSFPGKIKATRAYLRERDLLLQRDESDFLDLGDEDESDDEDEPVREPGDDQEGPDQEAESYVPAAARADDDEDAGA